MYEYLRCDCCGYVPDEFDLAQTNYYYLKVCHRCGRKACPYCLNILAKSVSELIQQMKYDDEDYRRWRSRCVICAGIHKGRIRGFHDAFIIEKTKKLYI